MSTHIAGCREPRGRHRQSGAEVVYVMGCEISGFANGFLPGEGIMNRMDALMSYAASGGWAALGPIMERLSAFLAAAGARERFGGRITYAFGPWEFVD
jgi:hypothetical protein